MIAPSGVWADTPGPAILNEPHPVRPGFLKLPRLRARHTRIAPVLACFAMGFGLPVAASGSAFSIIPEYDAAHRCACKSCRGKPSCCCAKGEAGAHSLAKTSTTSHKSAKTPVSGPRFSAAPCGEGDGLPPNRPGSPVSKATLAESMVICDGCPLPSLLLSPEPFVPASFEDRIDDPPERS